MANPVSFSQNYDGTMSVVVSATTAINDILLIGNGVVGMSMGAGVSGDTIQFKVQGRISGLPKATSVNWAVGDKLYWDNSAKKFTNVSSGNTLCARAYTAQANADTTCDLLLHLGA